MTKSWTPNSASLGRPSRGVESRRVAHATAAAGPSAEQGVDDVSCISSPLATKKAFFENVFKTKGTRPSQKPTARKVWSPRRKVQSSPVAKESPKIVLREPYIKKADNTVHQKALETGVLTPKAMPDIANNEEVSDGMTMKDVPVATELSVNNVAWKSHASALTLPSSIKVATDPPGGGETAAFKLEDPPGHSYMNNAESSEQMLSSVHDENEEPDEEMDPPQAAQVSEMQISPSKTASMSGPTPISIDTKTPSPHEAVTTGSPIFNDLKRMWGKKAAKSRPLSPEKDKVIAESKGQKLEEEDPEESLLIEVKSLSSDDAHEEKKEETEDMQLHVAKLRIQNSPSLTSKLLSNCPIEPSKKNDCDNGIAPRGGMNALRSSLFSELRQVCAAVQTAKGTATSVLEESGWEQAPVATDCKTDIELGHSKEGESTGSTAGGTVLLDDTVNRADYLKDPGTNHVTEEAAKSENKVEDEQSKDMACDDSTYDADDDVFGKLPEQPRKDPTDAIKTSAASLTSHAMRSLERYHAIMEITDQYRPQTAPKEKSSSSPIGDQIKMFEAFSKGENIDIRPTEHINSIEEVTSVADVADCSLSIRTPPSENRSKETREPSSPKRFSFYKANDETLNLLERLSEPIEAEAFVEEPRVPVDSLISCGYANKTVGAIESGGAVDDEGDEEDDEIVRVTKRAAAAREAASKMSSKSSCSHTASEIEKLPSTEAPIPDGAGDNPDSSILTDALTTAEMDTTLALDEDTFDEAMALVAGVDSADRTSPEDPNSLGISRSQSQQQEVVAHAKCGDAACVIM